MPEPSSLGFLAVMTGALCFRSRRS
ncbi:PEP-CTERM sorting domain-containing protein [Stieleria sp.]